MSETFEPRGDLGELRRQLSDVISSEEDPPVLDVPRPRRAGIVVWIKPERACPATHDSEEDSR